MFQSNLWRCHDKGLPIISVHLTSQNMEVVGGHRALSKLEVDVLASQIIVRAILGVSL